MKSRLHRSTSGFSLIEALIAMGILSVIAVGSMTFISYLSDNQMKMAKKFDQRVLLDQVRFLLSDAQLCKPTFNGQLDTDPLQNQTKDISHLKWGTTGTDLVRLNDPSTQLKVSALQVRVANTAPVTFQQADTANPNNPPITLRKYLATLKLSFATNNTGTDLGLKDVEIPFSINRAASDNSFVSCFTDNSPARICEDELGGTYSATDYPNCLITKLGVGLRYPSGTANLVVGPPGVAHNRNTPSLLEVNGNATIGETLFLGADKTAFFARNWTTAPLPYDVSLYVNSPPGSNTPGAYRWDSNGIFHAHMGHALTYSAGPPYTSDIVVPSNLFSGLFGNWNSFVPDDVVLAVKGRGYFRFDKYGVANAYSGFAFNHSTDPVGNAGHIASGQYTGLFAYWEPALPNDIGVFIRGDGQFRFHDGGDFIAKNNMFAVNFQTTSDRRLKSNVREVAGALDKVTSLRGVEFTWNEKTSRHGQKDVGLIAQEVEEVFPEVVKENLEGYKTVSYQNLIGPIIEALKELRTMIADAFDSRDRAWALERAELNARIEDQQRKLEEQRVEMDALKARLEAIENKLAK